MLSWYWHVLCMKYIALMNIFYCFNMYILCGRTCMTLKSVQN